MNIKDQILKEICASKIAVGDGELSRLFDIPREVVIREVVEINKLFPGLITIKNDRWGENNHSLFPVNARRYEYEALLAAGGFDAIEKANRERDQLQEQKLRLELDSLQLQIDALKQQTSDNKKTRLLSWIAIVIAAIPVLIELYKRCFPLSVFF